MSRQALDAFLEAANTDRDLAEGLVEAVGDKKGTAACEAVARYARARGYDISLEDAAALHRAAGRSAARDGDVADEDLGTLAGGFVNNDGFQNGANKTWDALAPGFLNKNTDWMAKW